MEFTATAPSNWPTSQPGFNFDLALAEMAAAPGLEYFGPEGTSKTPEKSILLETLDDLNQSGYGQKSLFSSLDEARASQRRVVQTPDDPSIPVTPSEKRTVVVLLREAIRNVQQAQDSEKVISVFRNGRYPDDRVELACWEMLEAMIRRHTDGAALTHNFVDKNSSNFPSFVDRLNCLVESLVFSKSICKHVLDPIYMHTLIDDPLAAIKRVESNKRVNDVKGKRLAKAMKDEAADSPVPPRNKKRKSVDHR